jgi:hypothetical protein
MAERRSLAQMATQPLSLSARRASSPASRARSLDGQSTLRPPGRGAEVASGQPGRLFQESSRFPKGRRQ